MSKRRDYEEFLSAKEVPPPQDLNLLVKGKIKRAIHPSSLHVFAKLIGVHFLGSFFSLLICPQFGIGPIGGGEGILEIFMKYGHFFCALGCGAVFFGISSLLAVFFLSPEELKVVRKSGIWEIPLLVATSWFFLMMLGDASSFSFTLIWMISGFFTCWMIHQCAAVIPGVWKR